MPLTACMELPSRAANASQNCTPLSNLLNLECPNTPEVIHMRRLKGNQPCLIFAGLGAAALVDFA